MSSPSAYALRMARLSARIFGEVARPTDSKSMKVVALFSEQPLAKRKETWDWYPPHNTYFALMRKLRFYGLYRPALWGKTSPSAKELPSAEPENGVLAFVLHALEMYRVVRWPEFGPNFWMETREMLRLETSPKRNQKADKHTKGSREELNKWWERKQERHQAKQPPGQGETNIRILKKSKEDSRNSEAKGSQRKEKGKERPQRNRVGLNGRSPPEGDGPAFGCRGAPELTTVITPGKNRMTSFIRLGICRWILQHL
ncbi:28S ribosomal protein S33, mitochondrial isoform X1 [Tachyglossus aculeatus]|uniref:28S ribosomal protein S33, mitochondrial isoform X1 n=1 Tax=Tachyglossus aculeatus TaxID=9261 RepID=UPI0018F54037|nr:28S ribosomal protein S33, mitochondrial isoform X1 [Tachyglossus aculeatus]XP_038608718.1 28S ribosomal protein S33, mitochondrial isoform X1 [Tachyglossus aculeatus]